MTDQVQTKAALQPQASVQPVTVTRPRGDLEFLSDADRTKLERLTAQSDARYEADAQNQAVMERFKRLMRFMFMRFDHGRWRPDKVKLLGYTIAGVAVLAFWNYWPRPNFAEAANSAGISLPIGSSVNTTTPASSDVTSTPQEAVLEPTITPPVSVPAAQLEPPPVDPTIQPSSAPTSSAYDPYERSSAPTSSSVDPSSAGVLSSNTAAAYGSTVGSRGIPGVNNEFDPSLESGFPRVATTGNVPRGTQRPAPRRLPEPQALVKTTPRSYPTPQALVNRERSSAGEPVAMNPSSGNGEAREPLTIQGAAGTPRANTPEPVTPSDPQGGNRAVVPQVGVLVNGSSSAASGNPANGAGFTEGRTNASSVSSVPAPGVLFDNTRSSNSPAGTVASAEQAAPPSPFPPGTKLAAKLVTGLVAIGGRAMPFAATLEDGSLVFGQAQLTESLRVQLTVLEVYKDKTSYSASGTGLDAAGFAGLTGTVRREGPDTVAQIFDATLRGLNGYIQGQASGTSSTTVAGGLATVQQQGPSLGWSVLGSLAQTFLPSGGAPAAQVITFVELKADTPFFVLFMPR
jgi:hypothetical protein